MRFLRAPVRLVQSRLRYPAPPCQQLSHHPAPPVSYPLPTSLSRHLHASSPAYLSGAHPHSQVVSRSHPKPKRRLLFPPICLTAYLNFVPPSAACAYLPRTIAQLRPGEQPS
ncbi:hypothetical protein C8R43DRAFT_1142150 [Mycena crocata]|nr:hypothetical protein C8R43DRAFT_1142150 [Mycena crocata]